MGRYYLKDQSLARARKVSVGIDVHKESWHVTAISEGEQFFSWPDTCRLFSAEEASELKGLQWENGPLKPCFDILLPLKIKELDQRIKGLAETPRYRERVRLLKSVAGIGTLTAMEILTELVEISRFGSAQQLASYLGLTASEYSSEDRVR